MKFLLIFLLAIPAYANVRTITFYDNAGPGGCVICCGRWSKFNRTASGKVPKVGVTAAANNLPFGTRIFIDGIGERIVQDRLANARSTGIDVFVSSHSQAKQLGVKKRKVWILK